MLASITVEVMRLLKLKKLSLFQILKIRWDYSCFGGFPCGTVAKNLSAKAGDAGSVPESGRSPGEGNGNPLQYSCLGNPMDRGAWWAIAREVAKSWTRLSTLAFMFFINKSF